MVKENPKKRLEIKRDIHWELWLISPFVEVMLGVFPTLEELNQAQITLYHSWEKARYPLESWTSQEEH